MRKMRMLKAAALLSMSFLLVASAAGQTVVAVNPLEASGELSAERDLISDIMQAELSVSENITIVERENLNKALRELQLAQQGMLSPESVREIGRILGAKYFCSGKLSKSGDKTMVVVRIIDIETTITKLAYSTLEGSDDAIAAGKALAANVEKLIIAFEAEKGRTAAAAAESATAREIPQSWKRPVVMVIIPEAHIAVNTIDPAGETELVKRFLEAGYTVKNSEYLLRVANDPSAAKTFFGGIKTSSDFAREHGVDILVYGEAFSEHGARLGEFHGCRARVEVKVIDTKTGNIILSDSAYGGATDLAEVVAGKMALQVAANRLADTIIYDIAEKWNADK